MNDDNDVPSEKLRMDEDSVLAELEALEVVEASELQEGLAFHAFKFR